MALELHEKISLMQVLAAAMWADGEVSHEERNFLKEVFTSFRLQPEDWRKIEPFIESPLSPDECQALLEDFSRTVNETSDIESVKKFVGEMFLAGGELSDQERRWRDGLLAVMDSTGSVSLLRNAVKRWFRQGAQERSSLLEDFYDSDGYFKNRMMFRLKRRLSQRGIAFPEGDESLERLCLSGGILGKVVYADRSLTPEESRSLSRVLGARGGLGSREIEVLKTLLEEPVSQDLDLFRLVTEYADRVDYGARLELLDLVYSLASADRVVSKAEQQQIEDIYFHLKIDRSDFVDVRAKCWDRFEK